VTPAPATIAKAIGAFAGSLAAGIGTAAADGMVQGWELGVAALAALGVAAGVWAVPNRGAA